MKNSIFTGIVLALLVSAGQAVAWSLKTSTDDLTDERTSTAYAVVFDYQYNNDFIIGFECTDNVVQFVIDVDAIIKGKGEAFKFSYRVDKKPASTITLNTYSNYSQGGYTADHAREIADNILGGSSMFARAVTWDNDYLEARFSLAGSDAVIVEVFEECGIKLAAPARKAKPATSSSRQGQAKSSSQNAEQEAGIAMSMAAGAITAAITSNWIQPQTSTLGLQVLLRIEVLKGGVVSSARVKKSSGNSLFDRSAEIAVLKASPLPIPNNPKYYPYVKEFDFRFSPNG